MTEPDGTFTVSGVTSSVLVFTEANHRFMTFRLSDEQPDEIRDVLVKMQPWIRLSSGSAVTSVITPDDATFSSDFENSFWDSIYLCSPCKEIGVDSSLERQWLLRLRWSGSTPLSLWAGTFYGGVTTHVNGRPEQSELTLKFSAGAVDTVLVGIDPHTTTAPQDPIRFELTIESVTSPIPLAVNRRRLD
jgi:hypothetical protein